MPGPDIPDPAWKQQGPDEELPCEACGWGIPRPGLCSYCEGAERADYAYTDMEENP